MNLVTYTTATLAHSKGRASSLDIVACDTFVAPRYLGLRMAFGKALDGLLPLMRSQGRRPTKPHPTSLS